jgi:hypothetical protein
VPAALGLELKEGPVLARGELQRLLVLPLQPLVVHNGRHPCPPALGRRRRGAAAMERNWGGGVRRGAWGGTVAGLLHALPGAFEPPLEPIARLLQYFTQGDAALPVRLRGCLEAERL